MNRTLILALGMAVLFASCNNTKSSATNDAATNKMDEIDQVANQAIKDSGVYVEYAELDKFIDQRPSTSGVFESEPLRGDLKKLLGNDYNYFMDGMSEATELKKDSIFFTTWGTLPDDAIKGFSYIIIDTKNNQLGAYQRIEGKIKKWGFVSDSSYIPAPIKKKIADFK